MQFRLRTLLIVLALGQVVGALGYRAYCEHLEQLRLRQVQEQLRVINILIRQPSSTNPALDRSEPNLLHPLSLDYGSERTKKPRQSERGYGACPSCSYITVRLQMFGRIVAKQ